MKQSGSGEGQSGDATVSVPPRSVSVSQLRAHLAATIEAVERGERVLVTKHNRVVVTIQRPETPGPSPVEMRAAEILAGFLATGDDRSAELPEVVPGSAQYAQQWAADVRGERDAESGVERARAGR